MTQTIAPIPKMKLSEKLRYGAEAAGFFTLIGLFRILGLDGASAFGGFLGRNVFYRTGVSTRARNNLRAAYPDMKDAEIESILIEMWDNLGRTISEYAHLEKLSMLGPDPRIAIEGIERADVAHAAGKGVLFVSGHFGNWELMPFAATQYGIEGGEVYRPLNNPYIDRWLVRRRMTLGPKYQIAKGAQGTRKIFTLLRGGKAILLLVDQKTNEGVPAPFFGRDAMTTPAPAALALKLGSTILPASLERLRGSRFRMMVHPAVEFAPTGDSERDTLALTIEINRRIEELVRLRPSQWLWIHRRWPKPGDKPRTRRGLDAQARMGAGVRVERDGSSLT
jgi:KDO2-lipid IV(A) lauroyltransferase